MGGDTGKRPAESPTNPSVNSTSFLSQGLSAAGSVAPPRTSAYQSSPSLSPSWPQLWKELRPAGLHRGDYNWDIHTERRLTMPCIADTPCTSLFLTILTGILTPQNQ